MNRRQINQAQSFLRVSEFTEKRLADFTHQPPTPVDAKFASARARLETAINTLEVIIGRIYKTDPTTLAT